MCFLFSVFFFFSIFSRFFVSSSLIPVLILIPPDFWLFFLSFSIPFFYAFVRVRVLNGFIYILFRFSVFGCGCGVTPIHHSFFCFSFFLDLGSCYVCANSRLCSFLGVFGFCYFSSLVFCFFLRFFSLSFGFDPMYMHLYYPSLPLLDFMLL